MFGEYLYVDVIVCVCGYVSECVWMCVRERVRESERERKREREGKVCFLKLGSILKSSKVVVFHNNVVRMDVQCLA